MKTFEVYARGNASDLQNCIFVKQGFNFFAAIFQLFWALYKKMWLVAAVLVAVNVVYTLLPGFIVLDKAASGILNIVIFAVIGYWANDLYSAVVRGRGYDLVSVVYAGSLDEARLKFIGANCSKLS